MVCKLININWVQEGICVDVVLFDLFVVYLVICIVEVSFCVDLVLVCRGSDNVVDIFIDFDNFVVLKGIDICFKSFCVFQVLISIFFDYFSGNVDGWLYKKFFR